MTKGVEYGLFFTVGLTEYKKRKGQKRRCIVLYCKKFIILTCSDQKRKGRSGSGPGPTPRARASPSWPWPFLLRAGPPISGPDPRTFRVGPGRPSGHGPLALPVDSLYAAQQRLDGYSEAVKHAMDRKTRFDRRVLESKGGEVTFDKGQLVQVYRNDLAKAIGTERKLIPMWSEPRRVLERLLNSYKLETLDGQPLDGEFHARRLRKFTPREGTELATQQKEFEAELITETDSEQESDPDDETTSVGEAPEQ
jgi:hypothetical protein